MTRYGPMFGPDITFLGVPACDLDEPDTYADADVVIVGAPFDGGTSHRPGTRFGPMAMRSTDYLPQDGVRPHMAMRVEALTEDLRVVDAGDLEVYSGDVVRSCQIIEDAVATVAEAGKIPLVLGGDHTVTWPDVTGVARAAGYGRVSVIHFDAHADTGDIEFGSLYGHGQPMRRLIESGAARGDRFLQLGLRGYWPGPDILDWMADQKMRSFHMSEIVAKGLDAGARTRPSPSPPTTATGSSCRSTSTSATPAMHRVPEPPSRGGSPRASCSMPSRASATSCRCSASTSWRSPRPTTTPRSPPSWATGSCWRRLSGIARRRKDGGQVALGPRDSAARRTRLRVGLRPPLTWHHHSVSHRLTLCVHPYGRLTMSLSGTK